MVLFNLLSCCKCHNTTSQHVLSSPVHFGFAWIQKRSDTAAEVALEGLCYNAVK